MENNTAKQADDATQNYLKEIYASHNDAYSRDMIKILEDLKTSQSPYCDWFAPKKYSYPLTEEHEGILLKHGVIDEDDIIESVFCFHDDIILELNKKMLDYWKSQYEAGNIDKESYKEEICEIIYKDFDVCLDTIEEIELFISGSHPDYSEGEYFYKYLIIILIIL